LSFSSSLLFAVFFVCPNLKVDEHFAILITYSGEEMGGQRKLPLLLSKVLKMGPILRNPGRRIL
jgi:hypothetical protein